ncbi:MAG: TolC family protein [Prevotellaceae bacterium]|jgi:outer membrane protein TolC|nr:TolC family protein [Prevotellaceae bacterium]
MKKYIILALLFIPFIIEAQETLSLKKCLEIAMQNNYSLKISRNTGEIAENNVSRANAGYLPTLSADASYSGTLNDSWQENVSGEKISTSGIHNQTFNIGTNLSWNIFQGFRVSTTYDRLKELNAIGELDTQVSIETMIASITNEYYNYVRQKQRYFNFEYVLSLSRERLRITETQYQLGARSKLEVLQARVDFNADSSNLVNQQQVVLSSATNLKTLMGSTISLEEQIEVDTLAIDINSTLEYNNLLDQSLNGNTSLLTAARNTAISELDLKIVRSRVLPYLRANAGYGYTHYRYGNSSTKINENLGLNYGLTLGINIFDGFNHQRNMKNARLEIKNKELRYQELEQDVRAGLFETYNSYQNNLQLLNLERMNVAVARENYEIAMERYKLGSLAGIELREAQKSFQDAEERMLLIEYQTKANEISLMRISGRLMEYL